MIPIIKGAEPRELLEYRMSPNASYEDMPTDVKNITKQSLLKEQGGLCAYCMCRINGEKGQKYTIEHLKPRAICSKQEALDYKNMVAVCEGNRNAHNNSSKTCDAKRGSLSVDKQKMKWIDIMDSASLECIKYKRDGEIYADNIEADEDLNERLNLNCEVRQLKDCRKKALQELQIQLQKKYPGRTIPAGRIQLLLKHYEEENPKTAFCGILIAWLKRKDG